MNHQTKVLSKPEKNNSIKHLSYFLCVWSLILFSVFMDVSCAQHPSPQTTSSPSTPEFITKQYKLEPFNLLYLKGGPLHIKLVDHATEAKLEIKGEEKAVKHVKIWTQTISKTLHINVSELHDSTPIDITLHAPQLKEIHHQSSKPVLIRHLRVPLSLIASGTGALNLEDIYSPFLQLQGSEKSHTQLSGRIDMLDAILQGRATLDTTRSYIQRSFIKTQDHAFALTGFNARSFAANALNHSVIRYTHDAPVQGLFAQHKAWIVRTLPN